MEGRHLCQNVRVSGYKTRERREQRRVCERERGAPARGVCAWVSDTEGRAGRRAGGRGQPARGGSVPAWSGPTRSCVSEGIQSGAELAAPSAASAGSAGRAPAGARPRQRLPLRSRCASPGDRAPDSRPPFRDGVPGDQRRGKPGTPARRGRPRFPPRLPGPSRDAGLGRTRRGLRRHDSAWVRAAGSAARAAQPPPPPGRWVWPPLGADLTRRSPSFLSRARASRPAGGRAGGGAGLSLHLRAPGERVAAALRRGPARPGSESAAVRRLPSPARAPPATCRAECDPPPPAIRRPLAASRGAARLGGTIPLSTVAPRPSAPPGAGCSGPQCPQTRRDCRRGVNAERPGRGTERSRSRVWAGGPGVRRRRPGLGIRPRTEAQDGGCFGGAERVLPALWTFPNLGRSAPLARTPLLARSRFGC